jgi:hypothetical protein
MSADGMAIKASNRVAVGKAHREMADSNHRAVRGG